MYDDEIHQIVEEVSAYIREGEYLKHNYSNELIKYDMLKIIRPQVNSILEDFEERYRRDENEF